MAQKDAQWSNIFPPSPSLGIPAVARVLVIEGKIAFTPISLKDLMTILDDRRRRDPGIWLTAHIMISW